MRGKLDSCIAIALFGMMFTITVPAYADLLNPGFENGWLNGWQITGEGATTASGIDHRTICPLPYSEPPIIEAIYGMNAWQVGDENGSIYGYGSKTSSISQTWTVGTVYKKLGFAWAVVGLAPADNSKKGDTPSYEVKFETISNGTATEIWHQDYHIGTADNPSPGWWQGAIEVNPDLGVDPPGVWGYMPWQTWDFDLQAYLGQEVRLTMTVSDCAIGGHAMYGYLDAYYEYNDPNSIFPSMPYIPFTFPEFHVWNVDMTSVQMGSTLAETPEPSTILLLGTGLLGLAGARRKFTHYISSNF